MGASWACCGIDRSPVGRKPRCSDVAVFTNMVTQGKLRVRFHLAGSPLRLHGLFVSAPLLQLSSASTFKSADRGGGLRRMHVRAMPRYTVRYRTPHIHALKPTSGCQRCRSMFEMHDQSGAVVSMGRIVNIYTLDTGTGDAGRARGAPKDFATVPKRTSTRIKRYLLLTPRCAVPRLFRGHTRTQS
jgi:hypothetical protein